MLFFTRLFHEFRNHNIENQNVIEFLRNDYLIKNDTLNAVFSKPKICNQTLGSNIIIGKQYSFQVKTSASETYEYLTRGQSLFSIEDEYFDYDEKVLFIEDCLNICGKTIK